MLKTVLTRILVSVCLPLLVLLMPGREVTETQAAPQTDFIDMLNMNYCYGTTFPDEEIANGALFSLLELAEEKNDGLWLPLEKLDFFTQAFYGKTVSYADFGLEVENGSVLIPAMGYDLYTHTLISATNEGNRVTVVSKVVCEGHDAENFDALCTSVFEKNESSAFGYNLISSEILA